MSGFPVRVNLVFDHYYKRTQQLLLRLPTSLPIAGSNTWVYTRQLWLYMISSGPVRFLLSDGRSVAQMSRLQYFTDSALCHNLDPRHTHRSKLEPNTKEQNPLY